MAKPLVLVDVDDTLYPLIDSLRQLDVTPCPDIDTDLRDYPWNIWGEVDELALRKLIEFFKYEGMDVQPIPGADVALHQLADRFRLEVVTARPRGAEQVTRDWIKKHFPKIFAEVHFTHRDSLSSPRDISKIEVARQLRARYLIDDFPPSFSDDSDIDLTVILFGDHPWNQTDWLPFNFVRAKDWPEVTRVLK